MKKTGNRIAERISQGHIRWRLVGYDLLAYLFTIMLLVGISPYLSHINKAEKIGILFLGALCIFAMRFLWQIYYQVWRYGGIRAYGNLVLADFSGGVVYLLVQHSIDMAGLSLGYVVAIVCTNLVLAMGMRLTYFSLYLWCSHADGKHMRFVGLVRDFIYKMGGTDIKLHEKKEKKKINLAIIGAGQVGVNLAGELLNDLNSNYIPCFFVEIDKTKIGRHVLGLPIFEEKEIDSLVIKKFEITEVVFALPQMPAEQKKSLYEVYSALGCKVKVYDTPVMQAINGKKYSLREFDVEDLLCRESVVFEIQKLLPYYQNKVVLVTGGGGSIGSELCRQVARLQPKKLIVLDVYENGAYNVQQELKMQYGKQLDLQLEIVSVCDYKGMEKIFASYQPDIVLHAAAHKHVPLMEHNCCEAVKNNIFGTLNVVELAEKYAVGRFILISTDKAVNPTNVMGATKRMCEMIVQSHSQNHSGVVYSATRFGNVLGSAGSVVPLFKRQIAEGGPITLTDRRITRYFMTIPEASQLVLQSGMYAKNGELFVLDMGQAVKILDLAENMVRLSGLEPYKEIDIVEIGLRPGEKLYEELLIQTENLDKTENHMIFIERDNPLPEDTLKQNLSTLRTVLGTEDDDLIKQTLKEIIPTYHSPEEFNRRVEKKQASA